ncbi:MAG TPA: ABC transporter permease [Steroidobacteraceae bacterium]|nr:ABC transporter permease [Steroidobacteraceae bacterium]
MLKQTFSITLLGLRSIPERIGPSLVIVVGLAGVVAVFTALLAMAAGFQSTLQATGRSDVAIVLRGGSQAELNSGLSRDQGTIIKQAPGIRSGEDGQPLASAEMVVIAELVRTGEKTSANITVRGVEPRAFALRPQLRVVEGRMFQPGLRELIVGRGVVEQFQGAGIGETLRMRGSVWTVVGVFESGDANESELWADVEVAQSTFNRQGYSAVRLALDDPDGLAALREHLLADPRVNVDVESEQQHYSGQTEQFRRTIGILAGVVTSIMALGAMFAALNTMYAAVGTRAREIATLRAIGFGGTPVVISVMIESLLLALAGGVIGALLAYLLFNNLAVSTLSANFTQIVFQFSVTPALVRDGVFIALVIGMVGGFLPALRAARLPVTTALRAA